MVSTVRPEGGLGPLFNVVIELQPASSSAAPRIRHLLAFRMSALLPFFLPTHWSVCPMQDEESHPIAPPEPAALNIGKGARMV